MINTVPENGSSTNITKVYYYYPLNIINSQSNIYLIVEDWDIHNLPFYNPRNMS